VTENLKFRRKNYFIKKRFQARFAIYFLALVILEAVLIGALFLYASKGTLTTAYLQEGLRIENTSSFFFVSFILITLIVGVMVGLSAMVVFIYLSHRMAGPLYRFEKSLDEITGGNLRYRIRLRKTDQFEELQNSLNNFIKSADDRVGGIKKDVLVILNILKQEKIDRDRLEETVERLKEKIEFFRTST